MTRLKSTGRYPNATRWLIECMVDDVGAIETVLYTHTVPRPTRRLADHTKAMADAQASLRRLAEYCNAMALYLNPNDIEDIFYSELVTDGSFLVVEEDEDDAD